MADRCCTRCGQVKTEAEFYKPRAHRGRGTLHTETRCRACYRLVTWERYRPFREYVDRVKLASGCVDCGYRAHTEALEFDHRPDEVKVEDVTKLVMRADWPSLLAEIEKCDVVCANCHRVRTAQRRAESLNVNADWDLRRSGAAAATPASVMQLAFDEAVPVVLVAPTGT